MKNKLLIAIISALVVICVILVAILFIVSNNKDSGSKRSNCKHDNPDKIVTVAAKDPTCAEMGLTEGKKCTKCGTMVVPQTNIEKTECKDLIIMPAVEPTCENTGLTEGKMCVTCGKIHIPQTTVAKLDCTPSDWIIDFDSTFESEGQMHIECTACGRIIQVEIIPVDTYVPIDLSINEFTSFASDFLSSAQGSAYANEETLYTYQFLSLLYQIAYNEHTSYEMSQLIANRVMDGTGLSEFIVGQMYGLYLWDEFDNSDVTFETMIDFMAEMANDENIGYLMDDQIASSLKDLSDGLEEFKRLMNTWVNKQDFSVFCQETFGDEGWVNMVPDLVFNFCNKNENGEVKMIDILRVVNGFSSMIPEEYTVYIANYIYVYDILDDECPYEEFVPRLERVVFSLTNEQLELNIDNTIVQQVYIAYFRSIGAIPDAKILGMNLLIFIEETVNTNSFLASLLTDESKNMLVDIITIARFVGDTQEYGYQKMAAKFQALKRSLITDLTDEITFSEDDIFILYVKYVKLYS